MSIPFSKLQGFGNDYIVIEKAFLPIGTDVSELARNICDRSTGVGSDGIALIEQDESDASDFTCEIVNPDGSIAGFSGNGTRCAVAYLHHSGIWSDPSLRLLTRSGLKNYKLIEQIGSAEYWFEAEIGKPHFVSDEIPVLTNSRREAVVNEAITVDDQQLKFSAVNVGNPVVCVFVDSFGLDWRRIGRLLESHDMFPERANIVFVMIQDRENIEIRIWERGAGETPASGTCASGAAVLSAFMLKTGREVKVHSQGGITEVHWRAADDEIMLTGKAEFAFSGEWPL